MVFCVAPDMIQFSYLLAFFPLNTFLKPVVFAQQLIETPGTVLLLMQNVLLISYLQHAGEKKQTFLQLKKSFFLPRSWHLCSKTCFILLSMMWLKLFLFVTSIASCSGKASVSSLPILREHTATLVSSDMLAFSFYFSLSHIEAATQGSASRLSALDQHWDGTQVANLCQVASMCFNRSRVVVGVFLWCPGLPLPCTLIDPPPCTDHQIILWFCEVCFSVYPECLTCHLELVFLNIYEILSTEFLYNFECYLLSSYNVFFVNCHVAQMEY